MRRKCSLWWTEAQKNDEHPKCNISSHLIIDWLASLLRFAKNFPDSSSLHCSGPACCEALRIAPGVDPAGAHRLCAVSTACAAAAHSQRLNRTCSEAEHRRPGSEYKSCHQSAGQKNIPFGSVAPGKFEGN